MKLTRKSCLEILFVRIGVLLSTCLTILFLAPFAFAQETQTVLKPDQLVTFSIAPKQEKLFVVQMKKGDFAEIQLLAREGLNVSLKIYDDARKELLEELDYGADSLWFVAPNDGDFTLVSKLREGQDDRTSSAERISLQYNNKLKLPRGSKVIGIRKVNGYDIKIMATPEDRDSILLIEKNGQLQKAMKRDGEFDFLGGNAAQLTRELRTTREKQSRAYLLDKLKTAQLIDSTPDKTGDGVPDIMINYFSGGAHCCFETYFFDLGDNVKLSEHLLRDNNENMHIRKNPKGGLLFEIADYSFAYWLTGFATSPAADVVLEFQNGKLRPNFELMKKPAPSLATLKNEAEFYRQKLSLKPYRGDENNDSLDFEDPFYKEGTYPHNENETYNGAIYRNVVFWGPMLDLIYTGHEELAWQFLDLVWPPQKQGKERFIRDFKNRLLQSPYWQMILEDQKK